MSLLPYYQLLGMHCPSCLEQKVNDKISFQIRQGQYTMLLRVFLVHGTGSKQNTSQKLKLNRHVVKIHGKLLS